MAAILALEGRDRNTWRSRMFLLVNKFEANLDSKSPYSPRQTIKKNRESSKSEGNQGESAAQALQRG